MRLIRNRCIPRFEMKHPPCCLLNKSKNFMSQTLEIIANLADCCVCVLFFLVIQRPWTFSGQATNAELPLCTGGRCHKWRILLRRSYTSSICMIPFVSCCEKDRKIIYSYIIEVHMLWSVQKDNVKQIREDIERIKSQPSNAWYFKSKSRNPRTMKRQGRKYPLQLKNTTTSTCSVALTQHAGFPWFPRKTL